MTKEENMQEWNIKFKKQQHLPLIAEERQVPDFEEYQAS